MYIIIATLLSSSLDSQWIFISVGPSLIVSGVIIFGQCPWNDGILRNPRRAHAARMGVDYQFSQSTMLTARVISSVAQAIGILLSIFRLWFRLQIRRLWWEDAWAGVACLLSILLLTSEWVYLKGDWRASVVGFWIYSLVLTCVVWAVRMSLLYSVARLLHPTPRVRWMVMGLATLFSLIALAFLTVKLWWYSIDQRWLRETAFYTMPARWLPRAMYIYELCTDCVSDAILILLPVRLLWGMNLRTKQRRMIIAIFSSSLIVTTTSIFRAVSQMRHLISLVGVATDCEVACSIITCNLLVITTLAYRFLHRRRTPATADSSSESDSEDDDYTTPVRAEVTTVEMTTVDLSAVTYSEGFSSLQDTCTSQVCQEDI